MFSLFSREFQPANRRDWYINVPWGKLALVSFGHPDGEPVLLVHGRQDSLEVFAPLLERMSPENHYVALDMPGNGLSDAFPHVSNVPLRPGDYHYAVVFRPPPTAKAPFVKFNHSQQALYYTPTSRNDPSPKLQRFHFLYAMELVVLHLGWDKFIFMGHSMGCEQGLFYNAVYPGQITTMILLDAGPTLMRMQIEDPHEYHRTYYDSYYENFHKENFVRKTYTRTLATQALKKLRDLNDEQCAQLLERNFHTLGNWHPIEDWHPNEIALRKMYQQTDFQKHDAGRIIHMPFSELRRACKMPVRSEYRVPTGLYAELERYLNERVNPQPKPNEMPEVLEVDQGPSRPLSPPLIDDHQRDERKLYDFFENLQESELKWPPKEPSNAMSKSDPPTPVFLSSDDDDVPIHYAGSPSRMPKIPQEHVEDDEEEDESKTNQAVKPLDDTCYFKALSNEAINLDGSFSIEKRLYVPTMLSDGIQQSWHGNRPSRKPRGGRKNRTFVDGSRQGRSSNNSSRQARNSASSSRRGGPSAGPSRAAGTSGGFPRVARSPTGPSWEPGTPPSPSWEPRTLPSPSWEPRTPTSPSWEPGASTSASGARATLTGPELGAAILFGTLEEGAEVDSEEERYYRRVKHLVDRMQELGYLSWDNRLKNLAPTNYGNDYYFELFKTIPPTLLIAASDGARNIPPIPKWHNGAKELLDKMATLKNFHRVDVEGSHDVHFTHPERVAPYINEFLKGKVMSKL